MGAGCAIDRYIGRWYQVYGPHGPLNNCIFHAEETGIGPGEWLVGHVYCVDPFYLAGYTAFKVQEIENPANARHIIDPEEVALWTLAAM